MLTKEDLGQIRDVVNTAITDVVPGIVRDVVQPMFIASEKRIIFAVGEMLSDNVLPQLDNIYDDIKVIKQDVSELKQDVKVLKEDMIEVKQDISELKQDVRTINAKMVTKGGLEDRLVDFRLAMSRSVA